MSSRLFPSPGKGFAHMTGAVIIEPQTLGSLVQHLNRSATRSIKVKALISPTFVCAAATAAATPRRLAPASPRARRAVRAARVGGLAERPGEMVVHVARRVAGEVRYKDAILRQILRVLRVRVIILILVVVGVFRVLLLGGRGDVDR